MGTINTMVRIETNRRYKGISAMSKFCGRSMTHIKRVLDRDRRPSPELRTKMEVAGIKFDSEGLAIELRGQEVQDANR